MVLPKVQGGQWENDGQKYWKDKKGEKNEVAEARRVFKGSLVFYIPGLLSEDVLGQMHKTMQ